MTRQVWAVVSVGAVVGLTWAAGLRAWMAELVSDESVVSWLTLVLILLPGAAVGGLLGWAAGRRAQGLAPTRWVALAPALFGVALFDPAILGALVRTGEGAGALLVVATALTGGFALSYRRWAAPRVAALVVWLLGMAVLTFMGTMAGPATTARGAWVCLLGGSLMVVLSVASTLPHRPGPALRDGTLTWVGAAAGLAWAGSLRGFMAEVLGDGSSVSWLGTFGWVLLPGTLVGALLGWAERERRRGRPHRFLVWSPILFVAVLLPGLTDLDALLDDGVGGGAIGVPVVLIVGAFALGARRAWVQRLCGMVFVAAISIWAFTATAVGGAEFAFNTSHGAWAAVLYYGLLVTGALATSLPLRSSPRPVPGSLIPGSAGARTTPSTLAAGSPAGSTLR